MKRRTLVLLIAVALALVFSALLRFVPRLNNLLAGRPPYLRAMTTLMSQEFTKALQARSPVILMGEDDHCENVKHPEIPEEQIEGYVYVLTYSERYRFSCIAVNAVLAGGTRFPGMQTIRPGQGTMEDGGRLLRPLNVVPVTRSAHVYSPDYLGLLHWRITPHFPITQQQADRLAAHRYDLGPSIQTEEHADINLDFNKARALVAATHRRVDFWLGAMLIFLVCVLSFLSFVLFRLYAKCFAHLTPYGYKLTVPMFIRQDVG